MKTEDTDHKSDRAATRCEIGVADGYFGDQITVEATDEGLEFGDGYSTLCWDWILSAFHRVHDRADKPSLGDRGSHTSDHESVTPS